MSIDPTRKKADDVEDILSDSLTVIGETPVVDSNTVTYGPLSLSIAPKARSVHWSCQANTLLADALFSPALFLAERIERGLMSAPGLTVLELGAGTALPSLLLSTSSPPPCLITITDYPDDNILHTLRANIAQNAGFFSPLCKVECRGYEWGQSPQALLELIPIDRPPGYDFMVLSDLLHFDSFHDHLVGSIISLLSKLESSRVHVAAGKYTSERTCNTFLGKAASAGLVFDEILLLPDEETWRGQMVVSGLNREDLTLRKRACRYWVGRWDLKNN
ncbi:hypothetical protein BDN72DRAFT_763276 [Pluteus cervinus]|uniref:Uncharacterized protein n=1 Tax=Pluteus cervinus TaxID=181527 RepID=A0ACD3B3U7_9AGAR|nr:hypothetical protein BDN72DRAFT_763276 [Pluteus cervinus]